MLHSHTADADFQHNTKPRKGNGLSNGLFQYIKSHIKKTQDALTLAAPIIDKGSYLLIKINDDDHIRIDESFSSHDVRFPFAHYTKVNADGSKVHVNFGVSGGLYAPGVDSQILQNAKDAREHLLIRLLAEREAHVNQLDQEISNLEKGLLKSKNTPQEISKICRDILSLLSEKNELALDEYDPREDLLQSLIAAPTKPQIVHTEEPELSETEARSLARLEPAPKTAPETASEQPNINKATQTLLTKYSNTDPKDLAAKFRIYCQLDAHIKAAIITGKKVNAKAIKKYQIIQQEMQSPQLLEYALLNSDLSDIKYFYERSTQPEGKRAQWFIGFIFKLIDELDKHHHRLDTIQAFIDEHWVLKFLLSYSAAQIDEETTLSLIFALACKEGCKAEDKLKALDFLLNFTPALYLDLRNGIFVSTLNAVSTTPNLRPDFFIRYLEYAIKQPRDFGLNQFAFSGSNLIATIQKSKKCKARRYNADATLMSLPSAWMSFSAFNSNRDLKDFEAIIKSSPAKADPLALFLAFEDIANRNAIHTIRSITAHNGGGCEFHVHSSRASAYATANAGKNSKPTGSPFAPGFCRNYYPSPEKDKELSSHFINRLEVILQEIHLLSEETLERTLETCSADLATFKKLSQVTSNKKDLYKSMIALERAKRVILELLIKKNPTKEKLLSLVVSIKHIQQAMDKYETSAKKEDKDKIIRSLDTEIKLSKECFELLTKHESSHISEKSEHAATSMFSIHKLKADELPKALKIEGGELPVPGLVFEGNWFPGLELSEDELAILSFDLNRLPPELQERVSACLKRDATITSELLEEIQSYLKINTPRSGPK